MRKMEEMSKKKEEKKREKMKRKKKGAKEGEGKAPGWIWWWKEEEREAKGGTSERREEEVGALSPCVSPDSSHAGAILGMLMRERVEMIMEVFDSVTPEVGCDESLLRILAKRKGRQILSLRHPCPDRAISSFIRTWCFWERNGLFMADCYGGRIIGYGITRGKK